MAASAVERVSLSDAVGNVAVLDEMALPDNQPFIEAQPVPLQYRANFDTDFEDKNAFISGVSKYIEEAQRHAELNKLLKEGNNHAVHLYTWRCCSRAVPMPKSNEQANRVEIYEKTVEVLKPEVQKLLELMYFHKRAIEKFCDEVKRLCHVEARKDFVSEAYLLTLGRMLNMFAVLDELKNMKASIKNDYSTFRRAAQFLQVMLDSQSLSESQELSMFLATQNRIRDVLRDKLQSIDTYDELLTDVVNICAHFYENRMYATPAEKHMLVKILGFGLYLIDADCGNVLKLEQKKRLHLHRFDKIFKLEVVPLFGDMQIMPFAFVKKSKTYDSSRWPLASQMADSDICQVNILDRMQEIRLQHTDYVSRLSKMHNEMAVYEKEGPRNEQENSGITQLALDGLQILCSWTSDVLELYSWKLLHPTDPRENKDCPSTAEEYERATRYNYSDAEKAALIEIISMIKGLQALLAKMECEFNQAIRLHVYAELQEFVQATLREPLRKAVKGKKDIIRCIIQSVRETAADFTQGHDPLEDSIAKGKKEHHDSAHEIRLARRPVPPSSTQLYMIRTMLESLLADRSGGKKTLRKDIDGHYLMQIEQFLKSSHFWQTLLAFSDTLDQCCDLSQLWYREFYLEMTMGQRIQFPIDMSMPWILTDYILQHKDPALMESVLYQLDLYNDSAQYALTKFKKQFLYDEVEAEVNLCFDQFVYKLSEQILTHYKQLAGNTMLDKRFRNECATFNFVIATPPANRYQTLLKQRHVQLLGRSIDLNRLITQRINVALLKSLDCAINRFESEDLTAIVELEGLIEVNRLCHKLLKVHLPGLTDFKALFAEANHNVSAPYGRVTLHVFWELNYDFLPNYCYNATTGRFIKVKNQALLQPVKRDKPPSAAAQYFWGNTVLNFAFSNIYFLYSSFLGTPHFSSICRLLGYQGIAVVLEELLKTCQNLLQSSICQYVGGLLAVMPDHCALPGVEFGSAKTIGLFYSVFQKMQTRFPGLRIDAWRMFNELGNSILFCLLTEQALGKEEICDLVQAAPFQGVLPRPSCKEGEKIELKIKRLEIKYSKLNILSTIEKYGNSKQIGISRECDLLTKERLCCGLSLFDVVLGRLKAMLCADSLFSGAVPANGVMNINECSEFHRLWSWMQFLFCLPVATESDANVEQLYGEGLHWAGCTIIATLGQQRRFDMLDFCYHILRVHRATGRDESLPGIGKISELVERIRRFQMLNNQIFGILNKFLAPSDPSDNGAVEHIRCFQPPCHQNFASNNIRL